MHFASRSFFIFLPLVLLVYHLLRQRSAKYRFLLAASWFFYMSWNPWFIWVILFTTVIDFLSGQLIENAMTPARKKMWLCLSLVTNLGFLGVFKYTHFLLDNGALAARSFLTDCWKSITPSVNRLKQASRFLRSRGCAALSQRHASVALRAMRNSYSSMAGLCAIV